MQQDQAQKVSAVSAEVTQVKDQASAANTKISEVSTDVGNVKTEVASTRSELEKTIAQLKATQGDLGVQSGLIATNGKELAALKALGERNYVEFKLAKTKGPQKVGDVSILLKKADPKTNRYTITVIADDKTVEKKDKTVNEPVQFMLAKASQPYELVVNDVKKDLITGYVGSPQGAADPQSELSGGSSLARATHWHSRPRSIAAKCVPPQSRFVRVPKVFLGGRCASIPVEIVPGPFAGIPGYECGISATTGQGSCFREPGESVGHGHCGLGFGQLVFA